MTYPSKSSPDKGDDTQPIDVSRRRIPLGNHDPNAHYCMVPMHDGVRLHTALYMPLSPGPYPTVLTRVPYDITAPDVFVSAVAPAFLDAGFAFVAQDTRGKARSEGDLTLFAHEATDGANTLDWITDQSWSSGDVFMWGESYSGSMTR